MLDNARQRRKNDPRFDLLSVREENSEEGVFVINGQEAKGRHYGGK